jgi:hypothetical protein
MESNISDYIRQSVKEMSRVIKSRITLDIWTGLGIDRNTGNIFACPTNGKNLKIYAVKKTAMSQWREGKYQFSYESLVGAYKIMGLSGTSSFGAKEINMFNQSSEKEGPNPSDSKAEPGTSTRANIIYANKSLIHELAFFLNEVYLCTINPVSKMGLRDGFVNPVVHEVSATVLDQNTLSLDTKSVDVVYKANVDMTKIEQVPKGGGRSSKRRFDPRNLYFKVNKSDNKNSGPTIGARINHAKTFVHQMDESDDCHIKERDEPLDGDVWYNGVRTSISNGLYEVWVDDIGGGPMYRASRQTVQEAAARYKKNISPTSERYSGYEVNKMAKHVSSNAITPVKIYVESWWEDPQLYAGIIAVLFTLMQSLDEKQDSFEFSERFIDAGAFDYDKMYRPMEGMNA